MKVSGPTGTTRQPKRTDVHHESLRRKALQLSCASSWLLLDQASWQQPQSSSQPSSAFLVLQGQIKIPVGLRLKPCVALSIAEVSEELMYPCLTRVSIRPSVTAPVKSPPCASCKPPAGTQSGCMVALIYIALESWIHPLTTFATLKAHGSVPLFGFLENPVVPFMSTEPRCPSLSRDPWDPSRLTNRKSPKGASAGVLVDVGFGEQKKILAVEWIWISTTKPPEAKMCPMLPSNNHGFGGPCLFFCGASSWKEPRQLYLEAVRRARDAQNQTNNKKGKARRTCNSPT